jgi:hypothetical protein
VYSGKKYIWITTTGNFGGKNVALGYFVIVVGGACVLLGFLFLAGHLIKPRYVAIYQSSQNGKLTRPLENWETTRISPGTTNRLLQQLLDELRDLVKPVHRSLFFYGL